MIVREIQKDIAKHLQKNKILILKAPSFTEGSDLIVNSLSTEQHLIFDFNDKKTKRLFKDFSKETFLEQIAGKHVVIFNEAQFLKNLQQFIEFVLFEEIQVNLICICSYNPPIDDILTEALTQNGLILEFQAPSFKEIANQIGLIEMEKTLEDRLIFGNYPEIVKDKENAAQKLTEYVNHISNYSFSKSERINKKENLKKVLQYLAFNIGQQLSYNQIGLKCALDNETVERYIAMLEKAFLIIKLPVFHTEKRYELQKSHCFYFYDNGIRNAFIQNFNDFDLRNDQDVLWKNWIIAERSKKLHSDNSSKKQYFWLTHTKQEIDYLELSAGNEKAFQIIWDKTDKFKIPKLFSSYYPKINCYKINRSSYWSFLIKA